MISKPQLHLNLTGDKKLTAIALRLDTLVDALNERSIPSELAEKINGRIRSINATGGFSVSVREMTSLYKEILKLIESELGVVPKNHHLKIWMALGMPAFGLPVGIMLSVLTGNYAFVSIGLPIGMGAGVAVGSAIDRKAATEGRQLNIE